MRLAQSVQDPYLLLVGPHGTGVDLVLAWRARPRPGHTWSRRLPCMTPSSTALLPSLRLTPGWGCLSYAAWTLWYLGYPDQALKRSQRGPGPGRRSWLTPLVWLLPWGLLPCSISPPGGTDSPESGQRRDDACQPSRGFRTGWRWDDGAGLGAGRAGAGRRRHCADAAGPGGLRATGAELVGRVLALLAEAYGKVGRSKKDLTVLAEALAAGGQDWGACTTRRSCIGCKASLRSLSLASRV